jgi:hypothetical protein
VERLDRQLSLAFSALAVVPVQSFRRDVTLTYFGVGSSRTKAHGYLYDGPDLKGELAERSCRITIMNVLSPKPCKAAEARRSGHAMLPFLVGCIDGKATPSFYLC